MRAFGSTGPAHRALLAVVLVSGGGLFDVVGWAQSTDVLSLAFARIVAPSIAVRRQAVVELAAILDRRPDARVRHALRGVALHDAAPVVREEAVRSLGEQSDPSDLPILRLAVLDENQSVRRAAVEAVRDRAWGFEVLAVALLDSSAQVRQDAVYALEHVQHDAIVTRLRQALGDAHPGVRAAAADVVGALLRNTRHVEP